MRRIVVVPSLLLGIAILGVMAIIFGTADHGGVTPAPTGAVAAGSAAVTRRATILVAVSPHWTPNGARVRDAQNEFDEQLQAGAPVVVMGDSVVAGIGQWVRVFVLASQQSWPGDYYAWLPVAQDGKQVLKVEAVMACPRELTVAALGPLTPQDRLRCAGGRQLEIDARAGFAGDYVAYVTTPSWFGTNNSNGADDTGTVSLIATTEEGAQLSPGDQAPWLDVQTAPGVPAMPLDFGLRVTGGFDHPDAATCRRGVAEAAPGLPPEVSADSVAWCRGRFVVTAWTIVTGPERRPIKAGEIQLHRTLFAGGACAGVGMPPLVFHVDVSQTDPVWITAGGAGHVYPVFSSAFTGVTTPESGVADPSGVIIRDGTVVNPDADFAGHSMCPGGRIVSFH